MKVGSQRHNFLVTHAKKRLIPYLKLLFHLWGEVGGGSIVSVVLFVYLLCNQIAKVMCC
jgi:hypothetical protein